MTLYKHTERHPLRWIIAIAVFVLAMTVTFDDVHGFWVTPTSGGATSTATTSTGLQPSQIVSELPTPVPTEETPPEVPEPVTLILLGSGLAAMHLKKKKKA